MKTKKISTQILEGFGFILGLAIFIIGITTKDMSMGWNLVTIISGGIMILLFKNS